MAARAGFSKTALLTSFGLAVALFVSGLFVAGGGGGALRGAGLGLAVCTTLFAFGIDRT